MQYIANFFQAPVQAQTHTQDPFQPIPRLYDSNKRLHEAYLKSF